jgi:transposase-like protein
MHDLVDSKVMAMLPSDVQLARGSRRTFSHEFKAETVKLIRDIDKSIGAICQELDYDTQ